MPTRRRKHGCRKLLSIITKFCRKFLYIMHYILALLVDILALALLWVPCIAAKSIIEMCRWTYAAISCVLRYSFGSIGHPVWRSGSVEEKERIGVVAQLERFGEGMRLMLIIPTGLWASVVILARNIVRNSDQSFPDIV